MNTAQFRCWFRVIVWTGFAVAMLLHLTGCANISERAEDVMAKGTAAIDRAEGLNDSLHARIAERADRNLCERISVGELLRRYSGRLNEWGILCNHREVPPDQEQVIDLLGRHRDATGRHRNISPSPR